jgi:hypothetical protein
MDFFGAFFGPLLYAFTLAQCCPLGSYISKAILRFFVHFYFWSDYFYIGEFLKFVIFFMIDQSKKLIATKKIELGKHCGLATIRC